MFTDSSSAKKAAADQPIRKFMFERSFDDGVIAPVRERRPLPYTQEQIEAIKKEAYDSGFTAGSKLSADDQGVRLNGILAKLEAQIESLISAAEAKRPEQELRMREAVLAIARKVLPDYTKRNGLEEIQTLVAGIIGEMTSEPRLVVRVNEAHLESVNTGVKDLTEKQAFTGKVVLLADANVPLDDCRIEWADGGIERNLGKLWQQIAETVAPGVALPEPAASAETSEKETQHG